MTSVPVALAPSPAASESPRNDAATVATVRAAVGLPVAARVAVAMSGGVDSSAVAGLLVEAGYAVFGLTARLYDVDLDDAATRRAGTCCAPEDARDARSVAQQLGIRHYVLDEREVFRRDVIDRFVGEWDAGDTPNPCVECNRSLKFDRLVAQALVLGAEALATGHYARLDRDDDGQPRLRRAADAAKDQSYFLYPLTGKAASFLRFPLGNLTKPEVRAHAVRLGLPTADKAESMDICFTGAKGARAYVEQAAGARPGAIVDVHGTTLGRHAGIAGFTVGQRHGLGLPSGPAAGVSGKNGMATVGSDDTAPRYVLDKRADGTVVVGGREALRVRELGLDGCSWVGEVPAVGTIVGVQVRHRGKAVLARVERSGEGAIGQNTRANSDFTLVIAGEMLGAGRGQAAVVYADDRVLGGGRIARVEMAAMGGQVTETGCVQPREAVA